MGEPFDVVVRIDGFSTLCESMDSVGKFGVGAGILPTKFQYSLRVDG